MTIEELSARLEKVERQNRRMRAGGLAALVLVAAVTAMGQTATPTKLIQAERFEVVNSDGKVRARLVAAPLNYTGLMFYDSEGKPRCGMGVGPTLDDGDASGTPAITMLDKDGKTWRATLGVTAKNGTQLELFDKAGKGRASLRVGPDGEPCLSLADKDGKVIERLPK